MPTAVCPECDEEVYVDADSEQGDVVSCGQDLEIAEAKDDNDTPKITVVVQMWGRPVTMDNLEFWQVDKI